MFNYNFYHALIKKYVIAFGTIFNTITISREDSDGNLIGQIKVPIQYAPKDKMLARLLADPDLTRQYAVLLPRMSFEITSPGFRYDPSRKLIPVTRYSVKDNDNANRVKYEYQPIPYDIFFSLYVYSNAVEDGLKIVEQIVPFFTPDFTPSLLLIPELNDTRDVPIELTNGPMMTDIYTDDFKTRRMISWQLNFTMRAWFFGPVRKGPIIKYAITNVKTANALNANGDIDIATADTGFKSTVTPGLTANGQPTSNASATIPVVEIFIDDDFGFITQTENLQP